MTKKTFQNVKQKNITVPHTHGNVCFILFKTNFLYALNLTSNWQYTNYAVTHLRMQSQVQAGQMPSNDHIFGL